mgnify:CR=1 FL=1
MEVGARPACGLAKERMRRSISRPCHPPTHLVRGAGDEGGAGVGNGGAALHARCVRVRHMCICARLVVCVGNYQGAQLWISLRRLCRRAAYSYAGTTSRYTAYSHRWHAYTV